MNAERLLALYERVAEAPDAITRLRRFILDLAVRGKLVPQDPNDEPASELLKRIAKEKARLVKAGEIPKFIEPKAVVGSDLAFEIPAHWHPSSVDHILNEIQTGPFGSSLHQSDYKVGGTPVINPASIQGERIIPIAKMAVDGDTLARLASFKLRCGDIVMARRGEMGRCAIVSVHEAGWLCGTGSLILRPSELIFTKFLVLIIGSPFGRDFLGGNSVGTTMQNLNQSILLKMPFGLPPLAEQHRIVAKVDELMALCDRLEATRKDREAKRDRLSAASLARLNTPDPETFTADARFTLEALPALTTRPNQIKQLRQTILNLAVRGKLVPQDPNDEPASELLKRITKEKVRLVKAGQAWKLDVDPVLANDAPFLMPSNWEWTRLGSVGDWGSGSTPPRGNSDLYGGGVTWLKSGELNDNRALIGSEETLTEVAVEKGSFRINQPGDVLIAMYGATIGKVAILAEAAVTNQAVCGCTPFPGLLNQFLFLFLLSQRQQFQSASEGGAQPNISKVKIVWTAFPLPPLTEQHRIVAKVDELMALCDRLEASLTTSDQTRTRLLEATLTEALAPASQSEMEAEE